jgi:hypothetical protein
LVILVILGIAVAASLRHPLAPGEEPPSGVGPFDEMAGPSEGRSTADQTSGSSGQR